MPQRMTVTVLLLLACCCSRKPTLLGDAQRAARDAVIISNKVISVSGRAVQLIDGQMVNVSASIPDTLWQNPGVKLDAAHGNASAQAFRFRVEGDGRAAAGRYGEELLNSGFQKTVSERAGASDITWFQGADGTMVKLTTGGDSSGQSILEVTVDASPQPTQQALR